MIYETQMMEFKKFKKMMDWFEKNIGTEYDINNDDDGAYSMSMFELTSTEVQKIREFENRL